MLLVQAVDMVICSLSVSEYQAGTQLSTVPEQLETALHPFDRDLITFPSALSG